jgi:hypothetical protein
LVVEKHPTFGIKTAAALRESKSERQRPGSMEVPGVTALEYIRAEDQLPDSSAAQLAPLDLAPLIGTWFATENDATWVTRLQARQEDGSLFVGAFGTAEPVDWGEVEAQPYGANVTSTSVVAFTAMFDFGFLVTVVAGRVSKGTLTLDTFNTFTDSSGRSNHFSRDVFHR